MAVLNYAIDPHMNTNLKDQMAQGANVGDYAYGSDGGYYRWDGNSWSREGGGGGDGGKIAPAFNFDWTKAREDALKELTPYYEQKLKDADYDVERAKRLIDEDYQKGLRYTEEDYSREQGYRTEDLATALKALGLDVAEETRETRGALNQRGVLLGQIEPGSQSSLAPDSSYARQFVLDPLQERQGQRKIAIERAMQRQEEQAGITKGRTTDELTTARTRGIEEQDIAYPRYKTALEEEKREKAFNTLTPMKYNEELTKYRAANELPS